MTKNEAIEILQNTAHDLLERTVTNHGEFVTALGRYQAPTGTLPIDDDNLWTPIAIHRGTLHLETDGRMICLGGARIIDTSVHSLGNAHQGRGDEAGIWLWDCD